MTGTHIAELFFATALALTIAAAGKSENPFSQPAAVETRSLSFKIARGTDPSGHIVYVDDDVHKIVYFSGGQYIPRALDQLNDLLKDRTSDQVPPNGMNKDLFDLLFEIKSKEEKRRPGLNVVFHVISGYRSSHTNAAERADVNNPYRLAMAEHSAHIDGKAIDLFVPELPGTELRDVAFCLKRGGVGTYPQFRSRFPYDYIHVDAARPRHWGFDASSIKCVKP